MAPNQYGPRVTRNNNSSDDKPTSFYVGMFMATLFGIMYYIRPIHFVLLICLLPFCTDNHHLLRTVLVFGVPMLISLILPIRASPFWRHHLFHSMLHYFDYEEYHETTPINLREVLQSGKQRYIFAACPHGMVPFTTLCYYLRNADAPPLAVARMALQTPILKHVLGLFGCIPLQPVQLQTLLERRSVSLWIGATDEVFEANETLYLTKRKGFIKLALQCPDVDVVPVFLFGNSCCYRPLRWTFLRQISQGLQMPFTYPVGRWGLPIPMDVKLLHVTGQPLGLPYLPNPRPHQVNHWHRVYRREVKRLFETYKDRHPNYKDKALVIV